ncbi:uncharacterized protein LOC135294539 [Passer domesticus]|uniref:uncharacterized protein LOC135294539 n=1 Tax=Passer domesticus TaxID=48849 RepID=UPI0030FEC0D8
MAAPLETVRLTAFVITFSLLVLPSMPWVVPQPRKNVWRTLADALGQDSLCLTTASAADPLSTCLVGIPSPPDELPPSIRDSLEPFFENKINRPSDPNPNVVWRRFANRLNQSKTEPLELKLLGSSAFHFCIQFFPYSDLDTSLQIANITANVSLCPSLSQITTSITQDFKPRSLPNGYFFICGDRAWQGIPSRLLGGPCTIGRLSLFTPSTSQIVNWQKIEVAPNSNRTRRDLTNLDSLCDEEIFHWSKPEEVAWITFLPWVAVAQSLGELGHLECWVAKQANLTSAALSDLLQDEEITRQATLQNRAAIDFLLLLHDHRCQDFEGLCCLNLTSKAEDVRLAIDQMREMISKIKEDSADWLGNLFSGWGLSGWLGSVLKTIILVVFVVLLVLIVISILWTILKRLMIKLTAPAVVNHVMELQPSEGEEDLRYEDFGYDCWEEDV